MYDEKQARCSCGFPRSVCGDPEFVGYPQRTVCYVEVELASAKYFWNKRHGEGSGRRFHNGDESVWSENQTSQTPVPFDAGVTLWIADQDYSPDDDFLAPDSQGADD